jgi:hypothetical protein
MSELEPASSGSAPGAAEAHCDFVVLKTCYQEASCQGMSVSECVAQTNETFVEVHGENCSGADEVTSSYEQCIQQLEDLACGGELPEACQGVIRFGG